MFSKVSGKEVWSSMDDPKILSVGRGREAITPG